MLLSIDHVFRDCYPPRQLLKQLEDSGFLSAGLFAFKTQPNAAVAQW